MNVYYKTLYNALNIRAPSKVLPEPFQISCSCVFHWRKKVIQVWN